MSRRRVDIRAVEADGLAQRSHASDIGHPRPDYAGYSHLAAST